MVITSTAQFFDGSPFAFAIDGVGEHSERALPAVRYFLPRDPGVSTANILPAWTLRAIG